MNRILHFSFFIVLYLQAAWGLTNVDLTYPDLDFFFEGTMDIFIACIILSPSVSQNPKFTNLWPQCDLSFEDFARKKSTGRSNEVEAQL